MFILLLSFVFLLPPSVFFVNSLLLSFDFEFLLPVFFVDALSFSFVDLSVGFFDVDDSLDAT
jgi:hypothetical protein